MASVGKQLEAHSDYWEGMEHMLFFRSLMSALSSGSQRFARDTERRVAWLADRSYHFPAMMLIGSFSYLEGELGHGWISSYGGTNKRELYVLKHIRNAVVHHAGNLSQLRPTPRRRIDARRGRPADIPIYVRRFASDLRRGRVKDRNGAAIDAYFVVMRTGEARLNDIAYSRIRFLSHVVMRNAGKLPSQ